MEKWVAEDIYLNDKNDFFKVYFGDDLVWQRPQNYLIIECTEDFLDMEYTTDGNKTPLFYYSKDGINFSEWDYKKIRLRYGEKLYLYGNNKESISDELNHFDTDLYSGGKCKIYGNLKALTNRDVEYLEYDYEFYGLFKNCTGITDISKLILPSGSKNMAFKKMFYECYGLTKGCVIPPVDMKNNMYESMFYDCRSLESLTCLTKSPSTNACYNWLYQAGYNVTGAKFYIKRGMYGKWQRNFSGIPTNFHIIEK